MKFSQWDINFDLNYMSQSKINAMIALIGNKSIVPINQLSKDNLPNVYEDETVIKIMEHIIEQTQSQGEDL